MAAARAALLVFLLLPLPGAAQPGAGMRPVAVALEALPAAIASAIAEAEDHLLADRAVRQLELAHAYVQGFQGLPEGSGSLREASLRAAYAWTGEVVEAFLAVPGRFVDAETAGAACTAYFDRVPASQAPAVSASTKRPGTARNASTTSPVQA
ncbi:MAG TPA: hypothetical protein VHI93_01245 [Candidatus Thermoplasmatota archaeon]|nr:hypothetical protein [Candidatus Thermoplasmatota archaeon]